MSSEIKFKEIHIRNFLSFGNINTVVDLSGDGSTLIIGENVDANSNNGAGKTTIINAITYALYNKPFDNISLQRLINSTNNTKNTLMEIRLFFSRGDDEFEIYRCRGENFNIQILMNGEDVTLDSVSENDKLVEELVGVSYELFTKIIIFSGNSTPFLQMPISHQRQQIEELFNITILSEKAVKLKEVIKSTENSIAIQEAVIREQDAQIAIYEKQLKDGKARIDRWENDRTAQIASIREQLELMKSVDIEAEKELHTLVDSLCKENSTLSTKLQVLNKDKTSASNEISKLESELKHLIDDKCPYCLQGYAGAGDKLEEKKQTLVALKEKLRTIQLNIDLVSAEISEKKDFIRDAETMMCFPSLSAAIKAEGDSANAAVKIKELEEAVNPHIEAYEQLKSTSIKRASTEQVDSLRKDLEHQQFLLKLLTDKNSFIRRKIINRTIPFLNNRLIVYTKELGLPHIVKFDDDMSCTVSEYGRELDFGNLSSGEKKRVNLSLSLAFRDVLHQLHSRVNCLFIDEIDASLDGSGVENVFRLLKMKARDDRLGLWIISHRPEAVGRFDKTVIVRKQNGFSRLITDEFGEAA